MCNIIHTDLKPENVLLCLTEKEIKEIANNGYLNISKKKKKLNDIQVKENSKSNEEDIDDKRKKKKNNKKKKQKQKKKLAKKLEKQGLNEEEIREELEKNNNKLKDEIVRKYTVDSNISKAKNQSINYDDYDIDDLIVKPKLKSIPKYTYDDTIDESNFEFDIKENSMKLQGYANQEFSMTKSRKELTQRKWQLENIIDENEKNEILKKRQILIKEKEEYQDLREC